MSRTSGWRMSGRGRVEAHVGRQGFLCIAEDGRDGLDEALGQRGQRHGPPEADEQFIVERVTQSRERAAHR